MRSSWKSEGNLRIHVFLRLTDFYMGSDNKDLAECLEHLTSNAEVSTVLGSIPAPSDIVKSEGRQMNQC